jgi:hypothetical protein
MQFSSCRKLYDYGNWDRAGFTVVGGGEESQNVEAPIGNNKFKTLNITLLRH